MTESAPVMLRMYPSNGSPSSFVRSRSENALPEPAISRRQFCMLDISSSTPMRNSRPAKFLTMQTARMLR